MAKQTNRIKGGRNYVKEPSTEKLCVLDEIPFGARHLMRRTCRRNLRSRRLHDD
jgi:hypothetical protein